MDDLRRVRPEGEEAKEKVEEESTSPPANSIWDCGSPLYDSYELASVTHIIERHWMIFPFQVANSSKNLSSSSHDEAARKSMSSPSKKTNVMNKITMMKMETEMKACNNTIITACEAKSKKKKKKTTTKRGFFARFFCCYSKNVTT